MTEQRTVLFRGHVQGVGFRATTSRIAAGLAVSGTVRNLPDGRVELVAEGEPEELNELLRQVRDHFPTHISKCETTTSPPTGEHDRFTIRY
ncbi:Acylphosphatase [Planctomycetes bacterium MalM25]|nr:Acylphosphatase [Planctomycetes bacterium MalM25]